MTSFNFERMQNIVRTGPEELGGALYVEQKINGERFDLMFANCRDVADKLRYGDVVERQLQDNDLVCLNRQPSLHKFSIMAMRVKILPAGSVFKL